MTRHGAAVAATIFLLAHGSGEAQVCSPQPFGVDPVNGNFTPTTWVEGSLSWVNNAVGATLVGVWANTDFDMWFVGYAGIESFPRNPAVAVHFDGFSLQPMQIAETGWLNGVWGSASNDVWAVGGQGLIVHWDGTQWVTVPSGTTENLHAVSGTVSDDVWAAGNRVMLHWDGTSWTPSPGFVPETYDQGTTGLAAISRDDALVATYFGCQRWDGTSWRRTECGVWGGRGIFATGSNDVWVVGFFQYQKVSRSYRAHWDGTGWSTTIAESSYWGSIAGTGPTDIWIQGTLHYDGTTWTQMNCGPRFDAMSVSSNGAFVGVNNLGIEYLAGNDDWPFLARTGVGWSSLGGRDPANVFAVGVLGTVIRFDGNRWSGQDYPLPREREYIISAFGSSPSDIWGASGVYNAGFRHFDGRGWTDVDVPQTFFNTGFARAPNDAIAVDTYHHPWHWDGTRWSEITLPIFGADSIAEFWGTGPDDVWAVGGNPDRSTGSIYHWDGNSWQLAYSASRYVSHVGGSAPDDTWFTIDQRSSTTVVHWDGTSFSETAGFPAFARGIAATSPSDVWLLRVGELFHYDGIAWSSEPVNPGMSTLWGVPAGGVFFLGPSSQIHQNR